MQNSEYDILSFSAIFQVESSNPSQHSLCMSYAATTTIDCTCRYAEHQYFHVMYLFAVFLIIIWSAMSIPCFTGFILCDCPTLLSAPLPLSLCFTCLFIREMNFRISENSSLRNFRLLQNKQNSSTVV
jgi:hypothetical protein